MKNQDTLKDIAYDAFVYAYPLMEQVKSINGMFSYMGLTPNKPAMNPKLPWENIGQPVVASNITSMTGGVFIDISHGPVTLEIPEVKDRYIVYQCIDVFTHNFCYLGTRGNHGDAGRFVFHNKHQDLPDSNATPILMEGDHALIVIRIDLASEDEYERVRAIQNAVQIADAPQEHRRYPTYDQKKAFSPDFVAYVNELLTEVPDTETALFERFAAIGIMSDVSLSADQKAEVQAGIDAAYAAIKQEIANLQIGNGYIGATTLFGTREFLNGNYMGRAAGANFGLWGNSKEEATYFMSFVEGEGDLVFVKEDLPPLSDIGFYSITAYDKNIYAMPNEYDSYVLTMDKMVFEDDGSLVVKFSSQPEEGNWLYTPSVKFVILLRVYQPDPDKIVDYVPPPFVKR